jgi:transcriptional regulator
MSPTKSDLPQGTLDLLILTVVASGPQHGYAIAQRLQRLSHEVIRVRQGSLYPALHRLDNRGLLATEWRQSETGRDAKYYRLTNKGRAELERERASWRKFTRAIDVVLRTAAMET